MTGTQKHAPGNLKRSNAATKSELERLRESANAYIHMNPPPQNSGDSKKNGGGNANTGLTQELESLVLKK